MPTLFASDGAAAPSTLPGAPLPRSRRIRARVLGTVAGGKRRLTSRGQWYRCTKAATSKEWAGAAAGVVSYNAAVMETASSRQVLEMQRSRRRGVGSRISTPPPATGAPRLPCIGLCRRMLGRIGCDHHSRQHTISLLHVDSGRPDSCLLQGPCSLSL